MANSLFVFVFVEAAQTAFSIAASRNRFLGGTLYSYYNIYFGLLSL